MARLKEIPWHLLGLMISGDACGLTFYRKPHGTLVFFNQAPPRTPASPLQKLHRDDWRSYATMWRALSAEIQEKWKAAADRAKLKVTGYGLWTWWQETQDTGRLRTIERNSGIELINTSA